MPSVTTQSTAKSFAYVDHILTGSAPHHAYLFNGTAREDLVSAAGEVARRFLCENRSIDDDHCASCALFQAGNHPDCFLLGSETSSIGVAEIRELIASFQQTAARAGYRFALLLDAERLTESAMNALLKSLEEPPPGAILILTTLQARKLLPTLRSRCYQVDLPRLTAQQVDNPLFDQFLAASAEERLALLPPSPAGVEAGRQRMAAEDFLRQLLQSGQQSLLPALQRTSQVARRTKLLRRLLTLFGALNQNVSPRLVLDSLVYSYD